MIPSYSCSLHNLLQPRSRSQNQDRWTWRLPGGTFLSPSYSTPLCCRSLTLAIWILQNLTRLLVAQREGPRCSRLLNILLLRRKAHLERAQLIAQRLP